MKNIICKIYLRKFSTSICQSQVKPISQNQANHQNFPMNIPSFSFSSTLDFESTLTLLSVDQYVIKGEQLIHQKNGRSKVFLPLKFENTAQFQLHIPPTHPMDYGTHGMQYIEVITHIHWKVMTGNTLSTPALYKHIIHVHSFNQAPANIPQN